MGAGRRCPDGGEGRGIQGAHSPLGRPVVLVPERACPRLLGPTSTTGTNPIERLVLRVEFLWREYRLIRVGSRQYMEMQVG